MKRRCRLSYLLGFLNCRKSCLMRGTAFIVNCCGLRIPLTCPVTLQCTAGDPHTRTHGGIAHLSRRCRRRNSAAPNANAEGGGPIGDAVAIIGPWTTLASARDPETVLCRVKHEQGRSKPLRSNNSLWKFFTVYLKDSLPGIAVRKLCEANVDFADGKVRFGSPLHYGRHDEERASRGPERT